MIARRCMTVSTLRCTLGCIGFIGLSMKPRIAVPLLWSSRNECDNLSVLPNAYIWFPLKATPAHRTALESFGSFPNEPSLCRIRFASFEHTGSRLSLLGPVWFLRPERRSINCPD